MQLSKETVFRDALIPAGQLAELVLVEQASATFRSRRNESLAQHLLEPLNLASLYITDPQNKADLTSLNTALRDYAKVLAQTLQLKMGRKSEAEKKKLFNAAIVTLGASIKPLINQLYSVMGYSPARRSVWMDKHTAVQTELNKGGRANKWRTFVRNTPLSQVAADYKLTGPMVARNLGSDVGKQKLPQLWRDVFGVQAVETQNIEDSVARLPSNVNVASTDAGLLKVTASFNPKLYLVRDKKDTTPITSLPDAIQDTLEPKSFHFECSYLTLAATVQKMEDLLAAEKEKTKEVQAAYDLWLSGTRVAALKAKLAKTFTKEELALLGVAEAVK